ncbi:hypothetical protein ACFQE5_15750 [Pseudonocardia hispaniensis]|uniref:Heparin binding hemagglutinin HbhA n=1 Tax=Pseudonocardia hispaniensis TaxID=904933 RepID=A0ABW1J5E7_9PSEU
MRTTGVMIMALSLPTSADVRNLREQAADQMEAARAPLMAVLGVGDQAVTAMNKALAGGRARAEAVQKRLGDLPTEVEGLRSKLATEEIRKTVEEWRAQATKYYEEFAKHGEQTWAELRKQPRIQRALDAIESYTAKLDAQVEEFVDEAHDAAEKAINVVTGQTRTAAEKSAESVKQAADEAAESVKEATDKAAQSVVETAEKAGGKTTAVERPAPKAVVKPAGPVTAPEASDVADTAADTTASAARRAANRTASKNATRSTATRRARDEGTASN